MATRPAIPAELRRRILVEAGHRCAIHTCRSSDVDVHHIIPWERCHEHAYENLIALCPNCHRRADAGEIDRKSLRLYKAQLAAALGIAETAGVAGQDARKLGIRRDRWTTCVLEESAKERVPYEITVEFPQFSPDEGDLAELNAVVQAEAIQRIHSYRRHRLLPSDPPDTPWAGSHDSYYEAFDVSLFSHEIISIKYSFSVYGAGAAHPNHFTRTANYQRNPLIPIFLKDILQDRDAAIDLISQLCQEDLARQKQLEAPDDWIRDGIPPKAENFQAYNILPEGLLLTFDPYHVGAYAEGPYQVSVSSYDLEPVIIPNTKVAALWAASRGA